MSNASPNTAAPHAREGWAYLPGLDGLRAVAVLAVYCYHANFPWATGGFLGVESFFVISGYLITGLLVREYLTAGYIALGRFWLRRARRLLPALWLVLAATVLLAVVWAPDALPRLREDVPAALFYFSNWLFIFHAIPYFEQFGRPPLLRHLWSLAVEEQFYLLWPLLFWILLGVFRVRDAGQVKRLVLPLLAGAAGAALWMAFLYDPLTDPARVYYGTDTRAAGLLVGAALALVWTPGRPVIRFKWVLDVCGLAGLLGLLWLYTSLTEFDPFLYQGGLLLNAGLTALVILAVAQADTWLARGLGQPVLRWIGARSYGLYLWHWPLIVLSGWETSPLLPSWLLRVVQLAAACIMADLSYRWLELPIRQRGFRAWGRAVHAQWRAGLRLSGTLVIAAILTGLVGLLPALTLMPAGAPSGMDAAPPLFTQISVVDSPTPERAETTPTRSAPPRTPAAATAPATTAPPGAAVTVSVPTEPVETATPTRTPAGLQATLIGDSIMATVEPWLRKRLDPKAYYIAASLNRRMLDALDLIPALAKDGHLARTVLIHLGTNQPFGAEVFDEVMNALLKRGVTRVIFVNIKRPVAWEGRVNQQLAEGVARWPGQANLVDWNTLGNTQPGWFISDQVHPNPTGAAAYAALLEQALNAPPAP